MRNKIWLKAKGILALTLAGLVLVSAAAPVAAKPTTAYADDRRAEIEKSLYNAEYYAKANEDVAVALEGDPDKLYQHWLNYGMAEGRNASMVFNAKYYLEVNQDVADAVGAENYTGAYEHFVTSGLLEGRESSPVFSVTYYLEANTDVAAAFNSDYVMAAQHFNESAISEGRSGSGNFDYTVYRACNTDVADLYDDYVQGYYIHYINHGRAEGRTGGLASGSSEPVIDTTATSYRIFDAGFYLNRYPELATTVGTEKDALYQYWISEGIALGQTASPVVVPEEYLERNTDVAEAFGDNYAGAIQHFIDYGIQEGRSASYEFDYTVYKYCNTDVAEVFGDDIVGYYFHYVNYGIAENRTARLTISEPEQPENPEEPETPEEPEENETIKVQGEDGIYFVLELDENGNLLAQKCYDEEETLLYTGTVSGEEASDTVTQIVFKNPDGEKLGQVYYEYATVSDGEKQQYVVSRKAVNAQQCGSPLYYVDCSGLKYSEEGTYTVLSQEARTNWTEQYDTNTGKSLKATEHSYNDAGTLQKITYYTEGNLWYYCAYTEWDDDRNSIRREYYDSNDVLESYEISTYYADGIEKTTTGYNVSDVAEFVYLYDESGYVTQETWYYSTAEGALEEYYVCDYTYHEYVDVALITQMSWYDSTDNLQLYTTYQYDEMGKLCEEADYDANEEQLSYVLYE